MSSKDEARRTTAQIAFDGANITASVLPYFISLTYTDNEEDETDDIQLRVQDRDSVWMEKWLNDAIQAAASTATASTAASSGATSYKVTPKIGLNVRSGPGTSYSKLGALVCGTVIEVSSISDGWATITFSGKTAYVSANYLEQTDSGGDSETAVASTTGLKIQGVFVRQNWNGDGKDKVLDCGQFELDSVKAAGPPATITIKGTSLPYSSQIRQTKKSKAWEACNLSALSNEMASANGMACMYLSTSDPYYARVEQYKASDIEFLSTLCHDSGISLKVTNNIIVLFDQATYEAKASVITIKRGAGGYMKYSLDVGEADTQYSSCRVSYVDPNTKKCIEAIAYVKDYKADSKNNQQLEVTAKVSSIAEAKLLAEKRLRLHNKYEKTASFTLPGNPDLVAGVTVMLESWGAWNGKYIIKQAKHTIDNDGYTVQIKLRRVLEGY